MCPICGNDIKSCVHTKYPKTPHLPFSPNADNGDVYLSDTSVFRGKRVVVTEKMDGENTTMYRDHIHARSLDSSHHPSRSWVKGLHADISHKIPEGWRVCGENIYAKHSIRYHNLTSYFYVFSIWNEENICLPWHKTIAYSTMFKTPTVPVVYNGEWDRQDILSSFGKYKESSDDEVEGFVVRSYDSFRFSEFTSNVAKYVREGHVQTDDHWMHQEVEKNEISFPQHYVFTS